MNLALQKLDSNDSSASGQSDSNDGEVLMSGTNTPEQTRVEEVNNHSSLDAARTRASSPKANSFVSKQPSKNYCINSWKEKPMPS